MQSRHSSDYIILYCLKRDEMVCSYFVNVKSGKYNAHHLLCSSFICSSRRVTCKKRHPEIFYTELHFTLSFFFYKYSRAPQMQTRNREHTRRFPPSTSSGPASSSSWPLPQLLLSAFAAAQRSVFCPSFFNSGLLVARIFVPPTERTLPPKFNER